MTGKFRTDIQGLRAIAVLSVVVFHYFPAAIPGGFTGVDIFFVISGFLITQSLLKDIEKSPLEMIAGFYRRRVRRLFPALFVLLGVCLLAGAFTMFAPAFRDLALSGVASALFVSNFYFLQTSGYFAPASEMMPLLHTWSLSIEEQFYIVFPILLLVTFRYFQRHVFAILLATTLLLYLCSEAVVWLRPSWGYYFTGARAFELLIGCALAVVPDRVGMSQRTAEILSASGVASMLAGFAVLDKAAHFPGAGALLPCLGAAAVLFTGAHRATVTGRVLSTAPMRFCGDISYSFYLWHWPPLAFLHYLLGPDLGVVTLLTALAASLVISWLSYRYVEQSLLRRTAPEFPYLRLGAGLISAACVLSLSIIVLNGMPQRFPDRVSALADARNDFSPRRSSCHYDFQEAFVYDDACIFGQNAQKPKPIVAVWGDSHGAELAFALGETAKKSDFAVSQLTASACPPSLKFAGAGRRNCISHNDYALREIVNDGRVKAVVLTAFVLSPAYSDHIKLKAGLTAAVAKLRADGKRVIIVLPIPTYDFDPSEVLARAALRGGSLVDMGMAKADFDAQSAEMVAFLRDVALQYSAEIYDPTSVLCSRQICQIYHREIGSLYFNSDHISLSAAEMMATQMQPIIERQMGERQSIN